MASRTDKSLQRVDSSSASAASGAKISTPRPTKRMQMVDIARMAGVSVSTVSRALSDSPLIPETTRERIQDLARSLHYQVNAGAANLRKRDVKTVGVAFLGHNMQAISDPFILSLVGAIADELDEHGMSVLLNRVSLDRREEMAALVTSGRVAGLIVIGQLTWSDYLNELARRGVPMAVWGANLPDALYPVVGSDNELGGYLATQHLIEQGARHIAFFGDVAHPEIRLRHDGMLRALTAAGMAFDERLLCPLIFGDTAIRQRIDEWLDQGLEFDAVFASSDIAAMAVIGALNRRGVAVPGQVKVVGYDDIPMSAYLHPSLTSVRQPTGQAGKHLVRLMFEAIEGRPRSTASLPTELIVRESSVQPRKVRAKTQR